MTETEAIGKVCPISMSGSPRLCIGGRCIAWTWFWDLEAAMDAAAVSTTDGYCGMLPENVTVDASHD